MEEKILNLLTQPMKTGEVAEATGIEKKEVEKIIKKLVKEGKVESPKRCYYAAVKIPGPTERGYQSDIRMPPAQKTTASGGDCYGFPSSVLTVSCQERK